jgi:hypothetical protein
MVPANSVLYDKKLLLQATDPYNEFSLLNRKPPEGGKSANWCSKHKHYDPCETIFLNN